MYVWVYSCSKQEYFPDQEKRMGSGVLSHGLGLTYDLVDCAPVLECENPQIMKSYSE